jgi:DNA polymerase-3 subunit gamma/tau
MSSHYLKYRPQTFADLDALEVRETLQKIFRSGQFPHAFLFSGPRGIGKTSAARIIAKAVNCEAVLKAAAETKAGRDFEPCNQCPSCLSITSGANVDILEIDAASNRGIDDIKELREKIRLSPAAAKYKVYIIDEVHMLTTEAFNALLKTLEEPPKHAIFILCTTDPEKLPKTIVSRCQQINFKKATEKEIVARLKRNCEKEGIKFEEEALVMIAKLADGGFRDAVKMLEQVSLAGEVSAEEVKKTAGVLAEYQPKDLLLLLKEKQTKKALLWVGEATAKGANLRVLTESLLETLRVLLLEEFGVKSQEPDAQLNFGPEELKTLLELFSRAYFQLRMAVIPQLPLEMVIIEWAGIDQVETEKGPSENPGLGNDQESAEKKESAVERAAKGEKKAEGVEKEEEGETVEGVSAPKESNLSLELVAAKWPQILEKVKPLNHSVLAFLKATRPVGCDGEFLILEVFYKFHKDQLESEKCRRIFEKSAAEVLGTPVKLRCSLSTNERETKSLPKLDDFPPPAAAPVAPKSEDDIIKLAEEIFNKGGIVQ